MWLVSVISLMIDLTHGEIYQLEDIQIRSKISRFKLLAKFNKF